MLSNDALKSALTAAHLISATDPKKLGLCSILLHFKEGNKLLVVGCDGFQAVVCTLSFTHGMEEKQFLVSRPDCRRLMKSLEPRLVCFPVISEGGRLSVGSESFEQVNHDYPDYAAAVIQKTGDETNGALVSAKDLCDLISAIGKKNIRIEVFNGKSPIRIIAEDIEAVIMPVRPDDADD